MTFGTWLLAGVLLAANALPADLVPMPKRTFDIPIRLDRSRLAEVKQLLLFVSTDQGKTWKQQAAVAPDSAAFNFLAPTEGEYWFAVCTVNQEGQQDPENVYKATPMKVLVDSLKPDLRVLSAERVGDEVVVKWEVKDANLDPDTLRLDYRTPEALPGTWTPVAVQAASGQASFRPGSLGAVQYRVEVKDLVGNAATVTGEVAAAATTTTASTAGAVSAGAGGPPPLVGMMPPPPAAPTPPPPQPTPAPLSPPAGDPTFAAVRQVSQTAPPQHMDQSSVWTQPVPGVVVSPAGTGQRIASSTGLPPAGPAPAGPVVPGLAGPAAPPAPTAPLPPLQIIKDPHITLQYTVRDVGPSGLGAVELYVTRDEGQTWQLASSQANVNPPAAADPKGAPGSAQLALTLDLPAEGVYGFYIVAKSKGNLGMPPPQPGTPPRLRVELDTTPPKATLFMQPGHHNTVLFTWEAFDRNLAANPITLEWAEHHEGPWNTIARDLPNTPSAYEWHLASGTVLPPSVFLRLTARDSAGNVCVAETPEPRLIDLSEPTVENIQLGGPMHP